jgi:hypothetical protein
MNITDQQLKGNWAEQYIAAQISSQGCLIRHVTQGHDSGIDLYCEKVKDGIPYLHFWCQVKTKNRWKGTRKSIAITPDKWHVEYWLKQPIPVFIFLVPDLRNEKNIPFYICRVVDRLINNNSILNSFIKISDTSTLNDFLDNMLPYETYIWGLKDGIISYLKKPKSGYIKNYPTGISQLFENKIRKTVFNTLHVFGNDILFEKRSPETILDTYPVNRNDLEGFDKAKPYIQALELLSLATNDKHYHYYELIGKYYELQNELKKSKDFYERSLSIIYEDPTSRSSNNPWVSIIRRVKSHIERVESKIKQVKMA